MDYTPLLLILPLMLLALYLINDYWTETEGLFTMTYLCVILGTIVGWTLTEQLDINIFLP
jgi:hypothetical protein